MKAIVNTSSGTKSVNIIESDVIFSEKELERLTDRFNNDTRVIEWMSGVTYCIEYVDSKKKFKSRRLKSSSLEELFEMYKCAWKGKEIPERKCFFHK